MDSFLDLSRRAPPAHVHRFSVQVVVMSGIRPLGSRALTGRETDWAAYAWPGLPLTDIWAKPGELMLMLMARPDRNRNGADAHDAGRARH